MPLVCASSLLRFAPRRAVPRTPPHHQSRHISTSQARLSRTALYPLHTKYGAKIVDFAGYEMPLVYNGKDAPDRIAGGQIAEHKAVREAAGLFDVSHMLQSTFEGPGATAFLEWITPLSTQSLETNGPIAKSSLSVLLNENGGILDDTVITRLDSNAYYVVTNAGRRSEDSAWLSAQLDAWHAKGNAKVTWSTLNDKALVALQGPQAHKALETLLSPSSFALQDLKAFHSTVADLGPASSVNIARAGYTGEDGFELSVASADAEALVEALLDYEPVKLAGLAARDSLRLEAGMCLYGQDLDEHTGVGEANLGWVVGKDRRTPGAFIGAEPTLRQLAKGGSPRKRIGLVLQGKGPAARPGALIYAADNTAEPIGAVSSGLRSPTLGANIAMGYVKNRAVYIKKGSALLVQIRDKFYPAEVVGLPFVPSKYYK